MDRQKFKRNIHIALIIFLGLALAITYFFLFFGWENIVGAISSVLTVLRPVTIGAIIAYLLKSTCNGYEKLFLKKLPTSTKRSEYKSRKAANVLAVILTYITWSAAFAVVLWIVLPQVIESVTKFIRDLITYAPSYINTITTWIEDFKAANPTVAPAIDTAWNSMLEWLSTELPNQLPDLGAYLITSVIGVAAFLKDFAVGIVLSVFFLGGRKVFAAKSKLLVHGVFKENHARALISEVKFADRMFSGFLEGKIIDSSIIATIYFITLEIMGIDYPGLHAVICLVTNIIPFFGPIIGAVPSAFIILMSHADEPIKLLYFIIFVAVIQFLDGNILDPHIVGGNIKLSPFCVIFAVTVFGGLWGFFGMLIGVPLFAVIYDIVRRIMRHRLKKIGKFDMIEEHLGQFKKPPKENNAEIKPQTANISSEQTLNQDCVNVASESSQDSVESNTDNTETV